MNDAKNAVLDANMSMDDNMGMDMHPRVPAAGAAQAPFVKIFFERA